MSLVVKTRRARKLPAATPALWVVLGLATAFFLLRYGQEVLMEHDLNSKVAQQRTANANLADENSRLQASLQYYQSDKYVEQRAREDLNLRRPDEEVLIPIGGQSQPATTTTDAPAAQSAPSPGAASGVQEPNWQRWLDLFNPFASDSSP